MNTFAMLYGGSNNTMTEQTPRSPATAAVTESSEGMGAVSTLIIMIGMVVVLRIIYEIA